MGAAAVNDHGYNYFRRISLIKNFPKAGNSRGNLSLRSDEPVSAYERRQIIEWSDFVGALASIRRKL